MYLCLAKNYFVSGSSQYFLLLYTTISDSVKKLEFLSYKLSGACYHITANVLKLNKTNGKCEIFIKEAFKYSWNSWNKEIY